MYHKYEYSVKIGIYNGYKIYAIYRKGRIVAVTAHAETVAQYVRNQHIVNILFDIRRESGNK